MSSYRRARFFTNFRRPLQGQPFPPNENFDFYGKTLSGRERQRERWERGVDLVNRGLGEAIGQVYVKQHFSPESKAKIDALVENLKGAYKAIGGLSGEQRFFLAYAQVRRSNYRDEELWSLVLSNPHAPPLTRVNGTVRNVDAWYEAFNVQPGDKLYLSPEQRVKIWQ